MRGTIYDTWHCDYCGMAYHDSTPKHALRINVVIPMDASRTAEVELHWQVCAACKDRIDAAGQLELSGEMG